MIKKIICIILCIVLLGCNRKNDETYNASLQLYQNYIDIIVNNKGVESKNIPFNYKLNVKKNEDNTYTYEIDIYNPQVPMYQIKAIAVDQSVDSNQYIYPCIGILGDDYERNFHMIPYQSNGKKGFVKMITLDAITSAEEFSVNVLVTFKDSTLQKESRVFFNCHYVPKKGDDTSGNKVTSDKGKSDASTNSNN